MHCKDIDALAQTYLDAELEEHDLHDFEEHIADCSECNEKVGQDRRFGDMMRRHLAAPPAPEMDHDDQNIIQGPELRSGKLYYPLELFSYIPFLKELVMPRLPKDSHAWMNIDSPKQGPMFAYTFAAAVKRTKDEWEKTLKGLSKEAKIPFRG